MLAGTKRSTLVVFLLLTVMGLFTTAQLLNAQEKSDTSFDWFYPEWAARAPYNKPVFVRDTESGLGRYALKTKEIDLRDLALFHGHLCDGLVIAFVEIKAVLEKLFPEGVVDRTDLRAVSKNGSCWVDAVCMMTGARINFQTLRIDAAIGDGFILQRISTGAAYDVHLKPDIFPEAQATLEAKIRQQRADGKPVSTSDINQYEEMADALSWKMLTTVPDRLLTITAKPEYRFRFNDLYDNRGDTINKNMQR